MTWFGDECDQLSKIASIYHKHGKYKQAENSYKLIIDMRLKNGDTSSLQLALAYYNLAEVYCDQSQYKRAAPFYQLAVSISQAHSPLNHVSGLWFSDAMAKLQMLAAELDEPETDEQLNKHA